jgi:hypothetical protein
MASGELGATAGGAFLRAMTGLLCAESVADGAPKINGTDPSGNAAAGAKLSVDLLHLSFHWKKTKG